jgi:hypothetical protein
MQIIGLGSVILFLASLASFMVAFYNPHMVTTGTSLGFLFLIVAALLLGITIMKRNKTERI